MRKKLFKVLLATGLVSTVLVQPNVSEASTNNAEIVVHSVQNDIELYQSAILSYQNNLKLQAKSNHPEAYNSILKSNLDRIQMYKEKIRDYVDNYYDWLNQYLSNEDKLKINHIFGIDFDIEKKAEYFRLKAEASENPIPTDNDDSESPNDVWMGVLKMADFLIGKAGSTVDNPLGRIAGVLSALDTYHGYWKFYRDTTIRVMKDSFASEDGNIENTKIYDIFEGGKFDLDETFFNQIAEEYHLNDDVPQIHSNSLNTENLSQPVRYEWTTPYDSKNEYYLMNFFYDYETQVYPVLLEKMKETGITDELEAWHKEQVENLLIKNFHLKPVY